MSTHLSRGEIISLIAALPLVAVAATGIASAGDDDSAGTKAQFKYSPKPGPGGKQCSQCALFQAPSSCAVVKGAILPTGYCGSFVPAAK